MNRSQLRTDIEMAINRNSAENGSDTPDFILAEYLLGCLELFDKTIHERSAWYSHHCRIGGCNHLETKEPEKQPTIENGLLCKNPVEPIEKYDCEDTSKVDIITKTCIICNSPRDGDDKYWCSACVKKQQLSVVDRGWVYEIVEKEIKNEKTKNPFEDSGFYRPYNGEPNY